MTSTVPTEGQCNQFTVFFQAGSVRRGYPPGIHGLGVFTYTADMQLT